MEKQIKYDFSRCNNLSFNIKKEKTIMVKGCRNEFPYFGARYPDAHCIDGYLWDLDSVEDGKFTIGGDEPCPFCNTEEWLNRVVGTIFETKTDALEWRDKIANRWNCQLIEK